MTLDSLDPSTPCVSFFAHVYQSLSGDRKTQANDWQAETAPSQVWQLRFWTLQPDLGPQQRWAEPPPTGPQCPFAQHQRRRRRGAHMPRKMSGLCDRGSIRFRRFPRKQHTLRIVLTLDRGRQKVGLHHSHGDNGEMVGLHHSMRMVSRP